MSQEPSDQPLTQGRRYNCSTSYGEPRVYSRIPAVVNIDTGSLTTFHRLPDGSLGDRVTSADASHFIIHTVTVVPSA